MKRATIVILVFLWFMLFSFLVLSGCTTRDITFFSQTGNIGNGKSSTVRPLPRQMTTRDLINRGRK